MKYFLSGNGELFFDPGEVEAGIRSFEEQKLLNEAIIFAVACHEGQFRKGSMQPYIFHPLEVMDILRKMDADNDLLMAGVLHDVVEDTEVTLNDIAERFGENVADLVAVHTEDKALPWEERKRKTIQLTEEGNIKIKMLIMADLVANQRSLLKDYQVLGEEVWNRFNAPKEMQSWYYDSLQDALYDMQYYAETRPIYWEMVSLYKDIFVKYLIDEKNDKIYQLTERDCFGMSKKDMFWVETVPPDLDVVEVVPRKYAEMLEDYWNKEHEDQCIEEMQGGRYDVYADDENAIILWFVEEQMHFTEDKKKEYFLDYAGTGKLLFALHQKYGFRTDVETIFRNEFGYQDGIKRILTMCEEQGITVYQQNK